MPPGVKPVHPRGVKSDAEGGELTSPNPKIPTREERERASDFPNGWTPELWKRLMGKAHNCPRINESVVGPLGMGLGLKWFFRPIAA